MPPVEVKLFRRADGTVLVDEWLEKQEPKVRYKCIGAIERLGQMGYELCIIPGREAASLGHGLYELRVRYGSVNYRILFFFHGREVVVLTHGFTKERQVPPKQIRLAMRMKAEYEVDPESHSAPLD